MERQVRALALALFLFLVSCNPSHISAKAHVTVDGKVQHAAGSPVSDARVALMKEPDVGDVFFGVASVGLTCFEQQLSACGETRVTTTGADGAFSYSLKGSETQGKFGNASILELTTLLPRGGNELAGPGVSTRFQVQAEHVTVPLVFWEPNVSITGTGPTVSVR